ncbi:MAG: hypothetical protein KDB14_11060 [Planctomycetales bacterium]|nr:hypothetical protein [Planctomycetales bacterium]
MFVYDNGLKLMPSGLAIDFRHRQPFGFISHAHGDHMARHAQAVCTANTSVIYQRRLGSRCVKVLDYGQPWQLGDTTLTTYPAGHMLGSAMLLAEQNGLRLLYTGDFQLASSRTAEPAGTLPRADVLVMESTFGLPRWDFGPRQNQEQRLVDTVRQSWDSGRAPVVFAYATGKAQEVTSLLHAAGLRVRVHPAIAEISNAYRHCGCDLPEPELYEAPRLAPGEVAIVPPRQHRGAKFLPCPAGSLKIGVSGWGLDPRTRHRLEVDVVVPLSDHADFPQLLQCVEQVQPQIVFCTHGPPEFVDELRAREFNAFPLDDKSPSLARRILDGPPNA